MCEEVGGGGGRGLCRQEKEKLHLPESPKESPRCGGGPPLSPAGPAPSDDVTEVTSRRPERGWGREADRAGVVCWSWRLLGSQREGERRADERARAGRRERRAAQRSAGAGPGRGGTTAGEEQPEPGARGPHPHSAGQCPVFPRAGGAAAADWPRQDRGGVATSTGEPARPRAPQSRGPGPVTDGGGRKRGGGGGAGDGEAAATPCHPPVRASGGWTRMWSSCILRGGGIRV